ncbi:HNH endonuclease signature motif containing protein [Actinotalea ferrariae]|uniref:HNH endonuclease signature motif containing protein n=1 Tax=Actinotalea ferrariae TaxID=1386098 RepID=UPI0012DE58C5|nr:HNH endonuclease signature motif containing protein [Actinotalea ferrariae]
MFDTNGGSRRRTDLGGVPEWAFSGAARLDAAVERRADPEVGGLGRRLAVLPGGPGLAVTIAELVGGGTPGAAAGEAAASQDGCESAAPEELDTGWGWLDDLDAASVVEVVAAFERTAAWARAGAARAAAALSDRPETRPQWPAAAGVVTEQCTASTDLSLRLGVTRHSARALVDVGRTLRGPMRQTGAALEVGDVDWDKARTLVEVLRDVPLAVSLEVEAAVLPSASALTRPQVARAAQRALQRVDHRDAAERHARARAGRHVGRPRILPDGMAAVTAVLPAEAAVRLDACLQAAAVSARRGGDGRTTDQLRADALDALARSAWAAGWIGSAPGAPRGGSPSPEVVSSVEAGASSGDPHEAVSGEWSPTANRTPVPAMRLAQDAGRGTLVSVTVGLGTLLGLDDRPGELAGYGPIGADVARLLATEGTWRRLLVDEVSGTLLDVDRRRYRPPAGIVDHVRRRNRTCVFPTCSVPAASCQVDHTVPFPHGPTAADNLGPLCTTHHQLKTHAGFRLEQPSPGSFVVRTPTGHVYVQPPDEQPGIPTTDVDGVESEPPF